MDAAEKYKANVFIPKVHLKQFTSLLVASKFGMGGWKKLVLQILSAVLEFDVNLRELLVYIISFILVV